MHYLPLKKIWQNRFVILFIFLSFSFCNIYASNLTVNISNLNGYNKYEIWGASGLGDWKSQLEFPLNVQILNIIYQDNIKAGSKDLFFKLAYTGNLSYAYTGKFLDYDWFYFIKDDIAISGEASTDINISKYSIELSGEVFSSDKWFWLTGYRREEYNHIIYNGKQTGLFGGYYYYDHIVFELDGEVLKYELEYSIPYIGIGIKGRPFEKLFLEFKGIYSPLVKARDFDDHLLNEKISKSKAEGKLSQLNLDITYSINDDSSISGIIGCQTIDTDGYQEQEDYSGKIIHKDIEARITGRQYSFGIAYQYSF